MTSLKGRATYLVYGISALVHLFVTTYKSFAISKKFIRFKQFQNQNVFQDNLINHWTVKIRFLNKIALGDSTKLTFSQKFLAKQIFLPQKKFIGVKFF